MKSEYEMPLVFSLAEVLDEKFVDTKTAAKMSGIALQTFINYRNGQTQSSLPPDPVGRVCASNARGADLYLRSDIERWADSRNA